MEILITGGNGQLGTELQRILREGRAEIGVISDIYKDAHVVSTDADTLDITDADAVAAYVKRDAVDLIVNCAAMTNVDGCEENEQVAYTINAAGVENLAAAAEACGAKLVQISTDYVFSGDAYVDRIETDDADPKSAYGRTKLAGEGLAQQSCSKVFIIRTAWLYGYVGSNFVKTMLRLARDNGAIKVVYDQYGNPTSANDLAYEILKIAATDDYGIYHCTNKGTCSWCDFASAILDSAGVACSKQPCTTDEFPRPAKRPSYSSLRNKHLEDTIGDEMRAWPDALKEYLRRLPELQG